MLPTKPVPHAATWMVATSLLLLTPAFAGQKPREWVPGIDPANFVGQVDNPYFPLSPGRSLHFRAQTRDGVETLLIEVRGQTRVVAGVTTTVVVETARLNDRTIEIAENWFAQDREGNVWYFGETTQDYDYETGAPTSTAGSWEAGVDGARPGIVMKAHPAPGDTYYQEFAPGVAQDMASVISVTRRVTVMGRAFDNVLLTKEWTALEPNSVEHKSYASGIGLILEEKGGVRLELTEVR
jgi:hypothetical protein